MPGQGAYPRTLPRTISPTAYTAASRAGFAAFLALILVEKGGQISLLVSSFPPSSFLHPSRTYDVPFEPENLQISNENGGTRKRNDDGEDEGDDDGDEEHAWWWW